MLILLLLPLLAMTGAAPSPVSPPVAAAVEAPGPQGPLAGTLLTPDAPNPPLVLIVPGSGPTNRDGDNTLGVRAGTYRLLAEGLAAEGIGSVRIDKRGMFGSEAAVPDPNAVTIGDYAADVHAWTKAIRARTGARCVWLLGHSEGGLVALKAAQEPDGLCGVILVSTAGRPLDVVLREQLAANPANAPLLPDVDRAIVLLKAGRTVDVATLPAPLQGLFLPRIQAYWMDLFAQDPATLIARVRLPILIVQGGRDVQISASDAQALRAAQPRARLAMLPDTNHVLKTVTTDDRAANLATYADPALPLADGALKAIAGFVKSGGR